MEEREKYNLYEYSPVIGVWVDDAVSAELDKENIDIHEYFKVIQKNEKSRTGNWRYFNLNEKHDYSANDNRWQDLSVECRNILETTGNKFTSQEFIESFTIDSSEPGKTEKFTIDTLKNECEWFGKVYSKLSKSPRTQLLTYSDLPRYIISFVTKPTDQKHLIVNLPIDFQNELIPKIKVIYRQYTVKVDTNTHQVTLLPHNAPVKFNVDKEKTSDLFQTEEIKKKIAFSPELYKEIVETLHTIKFKKIPKFLDSISMEVTQKRQQAIKSVSKFPFFQSSKLKNEDFQNITFRFALDQLVVGNLEYAKTLLLEALSKGYSKSWDVTFCLIHVLIEIGAPLEEIEQRFYELIPQKTDCRIMYLLMHITSKITSTKPFTRQKEMFLTRLLKREFPKDILITAIIGMCYEKMAGAALRDNRTRHVTLLLHYASEAYGKKMGIDPFRGHALRCNAFVQHMITADENHKEIFTCGGDNFEVLTNTQSIVTARWEELNTTTMNIIAKLLKRCELSYALPSIYFNLFAHCHSCIFAEKVLKGMLDATNRVITKNGIIQSINLPFFTVEEDASCIAYGTPEFFGYDKENYKTITSLWNKKTRQTSNIRKHWGLKSNDIIPTYLVCNEPAKFRMTIHRNNGSVPLHFSNIHVVSNDTNDSYPEEKINVRAPFTCETSQETIIARRKADEKIEIEENKLIKSSSCDMLTSQVSIDKESDKKPQTAQFDLTLVPRKQNCFTVDSINLQFWDIVPMNVKMPQFKIFGLTNQPSLAVTFKDVPEALNEDEIATFTIRVANVGDAPTKRLYCLYDNPEALQISQNSIIFDNKVSVFPVITDEKQGIKPGEEIEIKCYVQGQKSMFSIHMIWYFEANNPLTWRSYASEVTIDRCNSVKLNENREMEDQFIKLHLNSLAQTTTNGMKFNIDCQTKIVIEELQTILVPVKLILTNVSDTTLENIKIVASPRMPNEKDNKQILLWTGQTTYITEAIPPKSQKTYDFEILIRKTGQYNIASFIIDVDETYSYIPYKRFLTVTY